MRRLTLLLCAFLAAALAAQAAPNALRGLPGGVALSTPPAAASVRLRPVPRACAPRPAERLCAIHHHVRRVNMLRGRMEERHVQYRWVAERYPARRDRLVTYWTRTHERALHRYRAWRRAVLAARARASRSPWTAAWYADAMCVHSHEGAWNDDTGNGYYGGMQMDAGFEATYGAEFLRRYGEAGNWPPHDQLLAAYRAYVGWDGHAYDRSYARGWSPWPNTAATCGLL